MIRILVFIKMNTDWKALDDFYIISAGVFRRKKTEERPRGPSHLFDYSFVVFAEGVDVNGHRLARPHQPKLSFFEICSDPDVISRHY